MFVDPISRLVVALGRATGQLGRLMNVYAIRKVLGQEGRVLAWRALGAQIGVPVSIGPRVWMRHPANVAIGAGSKLGGRINIDAWARVEIGRNVLMNGDIDLLTAQHDVDSASFEGEPAAITIGDHVWMPLSIIVLPGVRIGQCAVIGSGSVVPRDVPEYAVVAGNPARIVKERRRGDYTYVPAEE